MSTENLKKRITDFSTRSKIEDKLEARSLVEDFLDALDAGIIRSAEKVEGSWKAVDWVKSGILLTFQIGQNSIFPKSLRNALQRSEVAPPGVENGPKFFFAPSTQFDL